MTLRKCIFGIFLLTGIIFSQNFQVVKILESNKYLLNNSSVVRLAGIDVPSKNHENFLLASYAHQIIKYSEINLLNQTVQIKPADDFSGKGENRYVSMFVGGDDFAESLLSMGFVKVDSLAFSKTEKYLEVEKEARENKAGLWSYDQTLYQLAGRFDKTFKAKAKEKKPRVVRYDRSFQRIASEFAFGPILGLLGTGLGSVVLGSIIKFKSCEFFCADAVYTVLGLYAFMTSTAIYIIAEDGNDKVNYLSTVLYGMGGTAFGLLLAAASNQNALEATGGVIALLAPIIGPILYANVFADFPDVDEHGNHIVPTIPSVTHSDYYNSTQMFSMDLLRVPLK